MTEAAETVADAGEDEGDRMIGEIGDLVFGNSRFRTSIRLLAIRLAKGWQLTPGADVLMSTMRSIVISIMIASGDKQEVDDDEDDDEEEDECRTRVPIDEGRARVRAKA
jgi:hypothetical protein